VNPDEQAVLRAAEQRAAALANADAAALRRLMHPMLTWTSHRGETLDLDAYVAGNTDGSLVWHEQRLEQPLVTVVDGVGVLTATVLDVVERDGKREVFRMRVTQTWVREGREWRCLAGHAGPRL
jgi:ketosteroid isomerase-like protein